MLRESVRERERDGVNKVVEGGKSKFTLILINGRRRKYRERGNVAIKMASLRE